MTISPLIFLAKEWGWPWPNSFTSLAKGHGYLPTFLVEGWWLPWPYSSFSLEEKGRGHDHLSLGPSGHGMGWLEWVGRWMGGAMVTFPPSF